MSMINHISGMNEIIQRTRIYPMALRFFSPLSGECFAELPAGLITFCSGTPPPSPMKESGVTQSFCSFAIKPKRTFAWEFEYLPFVCALNPSRLQFRCKDDPEINDFHLLRPRCVCRYLPSAIKLYNEEAGYEKEKALRLPLYFIATQISLNEVFQ